jgi:hypothetical protein
MSEDKAVIALRNVLATLKRENERPSGPIRDTIWHGDAETLFDYIESALEEIDSKPAPTGIEFRMMGPKLAFVVGNQCFTLDYEPDSDEEAEFMQRMLCHALSGFTPDVKTSGADAQPARAPLTEEQIIRSTDEINMDVPGCFIRIARAIERAHGIGEAGNA